MTPLSGPLPDAFLRRIQAQLGVEAQAYLAALDQPAVMGLRVNTLKLSPAELARLVDWSLEPIPWCDTGFVWEGEARPGKHPYHAAGLYYLQEPSAMAPAEVLRPQPGEWVLDLAAAPGGKATQLATLMRDAGLLVANEVEPRRVRALTENLERFGVRRLLITNEFPQRLVERWGAIFDRVLVDAPCSGEGMFRKSPSTRAEWSEETVRGCASRQRKLLATAAELVKPGGLLAYSTCTFAPEENEQIIDEFLSEHPEFVMKRVELPGVEGNRLWPHRVRGEGHFVALMQRQGEGWPAPTAEWPEAPRRIREVWQGFVTASLAGDPIEGGRLIAMGDRVYAAPPELPALNGVKVARVGLWLGTLKRDRFEPAHALALALPAPRSGRRLDLTPSDDRLSRYLRGEALREPGEDGWLLVTVDGFGIGWGRRAKGVIKNAYPKALRWMG